MIMDILKQKNNLLMDQDGNIYVAPTSQFEFKTAPFEEGENCLLISQDSYLGLLLKLYQFDESLSNVEMFDAQKFMSFLQSKFSRGAE